MAYTLFSNPRLETFACLRNSLKFTVEQGSLHFAICPKQGPKIEDVVLHRVGILGLFFVLKT